jgi:hypothetical protein
MADRPRLTYEQLEAAFIDAVGGMARLQARQEALECFIRAVIVESPPAHPLFWKALHTAQSDLSLRQDEARAETPPEIARAALQLLNVLRDACAPPQGAGAAP